MSDVATALCRCEFGWIHVKADRNTVYPCKVCRPREFFRWCEGHWSSDHDRAACPTCIEVVVPHRRSSSRSTRSRTVHDNPDSHIEPREHENF